jgi:hypothetical protein
MRNWPSRLLPILIYAAAFSVMGRYDMPWYVQTVIVAAVAFAGAFSFSRSVVR